MGEEQPNKKERMIQIILITVLIIISASAVIGLTYTSGVFSEQLPPEPVLTQSYESISAVSAYDIINTSEEFVIVDVRPCSCNYNTEHIGDGEIFEAVLPPEDNANLINSTIDIIVYDADGGSDAITYCERFINLTYGKICYLQGGFNTWKNEGFPTIRPGEH